jgi:hypothetical protein
VLGRVGREPAPTEEHVAEAEEPPPSPLRWIPIVALAAFVVILALLLF